MTPTSFILVEDHSLFRNSVVETLEDSGRFGRQQIDQFVVKVQFGSLPTFAVGHHLEAGHREDPVPDR